MGRRRRKFTWLPTVGTVGFSPEEPANSAIISEVIVENVPNGEFLGTPDSVVFPIINDFPQEPFDSNQGSTTEGIGEIIGNEYVIERIVGELYVGYTAGNGTSGNATVLVCAGIFVARSDSVQPAAPIGLTATNYSPLALQNIREPWMFYRTWLLSGGFAQVGNPFATASATGLNAVGRTNNGQNAGASMFEGPHIDVKSVRRIRQDERCYLTISAQGYNPLGDASTTLTGKLEIIMNIRALGALRQAKSRGAF